MNVNRQLIINNLNRLVSLSRRIDSLFNSSIRNFLIDIYWEKIIKPYYINCGINFINSYYEIYSTRLHISILSILMRKKLHVIDNSYGKTSSFMNTWFTLDERKDFINASLS